MIDATGHEVHWDPGEPPKPSHNPWDDPNVTRALKNGRLPSDISLICCRSCNLYGYYNNGSHFTCSECGWSASGDTLDAIIDNCDVTTLQDYIRCNQT
jgi:hypothetical protein